MAGETEIKLLASPAMLAGLQQIGPLAGPATTIALHTTYFDSADRRLAQAGLSLRLRRNGDAAEATVKRDGAVRRGEWTVPADSDTPRLDTFPAQVRKRLDKALAGATPAPIAGTRIERATRRMRHDGSLIDLAFDSGRIEAGDDREAVCEVELELVRGRLGDVLALARTLPLGPDLRWSVLSKGDRCDRLARGTTPAAVHARALALHADTDLAGAFHAVAWNCLDHLLSNYLLVVATGDDEAIHQCRVAMRRLLAAWKAFGTRVADDRLPVLRAGIKAAGRTLGQSRDLYILHQRLAELAPDDPLLAQIAGHQAEATRAAQDALASAAFQALLFDLAHWIEAGAWRDGDALGEPLGPFARRVLARSQRKLSPKHKPLTAMSAEALHRLRKRGKQLRYAARFFDGLWGDDDDQRKSVLHALGELQDHLGAVHDVDAAGTLLAGQDPIAAAETAARLRQLLEGDAALRKKHLHAARKALRKVRKDGVFD